jgi:hypothetical protein
MTMKGYDNMNIRGKDGRVLSEDSITPEELTKLWNSANTQEKIIIACAGFEGMRDSEYLHMEPSWIHFNDSKTEKYNTSALIRIPGVTKKFKQLCNCDDCQLRAYRDYRQKVADEENNDVHVIHNKKWHTQVQKDFYKLPLTYPKEAELILNKLAKLDKLPEQEKQKRRTIK